MNRLIGLTAFVVKKGKKSIVVRKTWELIQKIQFEIEYCIARISKKDFQVEIMSIHETLDYILNNKVSVVRFGDGEFSIMANKNICPFQSYSVELAAKLTETINKVNTHNLLICLPETMSDIGKFRTKTRKHWTVTFMKNYDVYKNNIHHEYIYGNAFLSRPYIIYEDKSACASIFQKLLTLFTDQDIVIIEGEYSRNGVGNSLFSKAKSVKRIICPPNDAFSQYQEILHATENIPLHSLVLVSIGPASKPLVADLSNRGYWVLDIGHIDSEYEWYRHNAIEKTTIEGKHTAEGLDENILPCNDSAYLASILRRIGVDE